MQIETIEHGKSALINVQDMGAKRNAWLFLTMLNHFDPFTSKTPIWENKTAWIPSLNDVSMRAIGNSAALAM